jgi:hypothetical protein
MRESQQTRIMTFEVAGRAKGDAIPVVVSSDAVVDVVDGPEILVHTADAIDLQRAPLPIIATHQSGQINVGIVDDLRISAGKLRGMARFGDRPEAAAYKADVLKGIIRALSVGYQRIKAAARKDGVLVTTRWMPTHAAMVAEPADVQAGFFRSAQQPRPPRRRTVLILREVRIPRGVLVTLDLPMADAMQSLGFAADAGEGW